MGNHQTILAEKLPSNNDKNQPFLIQQIVAQTPQQHHQIIAQIAQLKSLSAPNLLRVIDAHTVQTQNICSTISYIYALIEHLPYNITTYKQHRRNHKRKFTNSDVVAILIGCSRGLQQLKKAEIEVNTISESMVYLSEENQQINVKLMLPFFIQEYIDTPNEQTLQSSLADLIISLQAELSEDVSTLIDSIKIGEVNISCLQQRLTTSCHKKPKILVSKPKKDKKDNKARQSLHSLTSNGQSLLISGEVSELMFKDFYQHFDNSLSDIEMRSMQGYQTGEDLKLDGHKFPKRYIKSKAFRKRKGLWSEWSDKGQEQSITRDQSVRDNVKNASINFLFDSAKLVQSFIGACDR